MRLMSFLLCFLFSLLATAQNSLNYKVFYDKKMETKGLKVQLNFEKKVKSDSTVLYYSNNLWGEKDLFNCLLINDKENKNSHYKTNAKKNQIIIYHKKTKDVQFTYRIKQDFDVSEKGVFFRPRVKNNYFAILAEELFVIPYSLNETPDSPIVSIEIDWLNFPKEFKIHNSYGNQEKKQKFTTDLWEEFYNSFFVGGDFRIYDFKIKNKPVHFVVRGEWYNGFTDDVLFDSFKQAVTSQRDFWQDYSQDYFSFMMLPSISSQDKNNRTRSSTGTALKNGFYIVSNNNLYNDKLAYDYVLHHELMHEWIGSKIKIKHGPLNYWFSEGFTDYYTFKNRLRIGYMSTQNWVNEFNANVISKHWENPFKNSPNYIIKDKFWDNHDVSKLPYRRGTIFAFWLDNQILLKSNYTKSLDDVMKNMLKKCQSENNEFTEEFFIDTLSNYLDIDMAYVIQKHIIHGEDIDLINAKWVDGFKFEDVNGTPKLVLSNKGNIKYIQN